MKAKYISIVVFVIIASLYGCANMQEKDFYGVVLEDASITDRMLLLAQKGEKEVFVKVLINNRTTMLFASEDQQEKFQRLSQFKKGNDIHIKMAFEEISDDGKIFYYVHSWRVFWDTKYHH